MKASAIKKASPVDLTSQIQGPVTFGSLKEAERTGFFDELEIFPNPRGGRLSPGAPNISGKENGKLLRVACAIAKSAPRQPVVFLMATGNAVVSLPSRFVVPLMF